MNTDNLTMGVNGMNGFFSTGGGFEKLVSTATKVAGGVQTVKAALKQPSTVPQVGTSVAPVYPTTPPPAPSSQIVPASMQPYIKYAGWALAAGVAVYAAKKLL